jgi:hypothetical protein
MTQRWHAAVAGSVNKPGQFDSMFIVPQLRDVRFAYGSGHPVVGLEC